MKERQKKRSIFSWKFFWIAFVFGIIVLGVECIGKEHFYCKENAEAL